MLIRVLKSLRHGSQMVRHRKYLENTKINFYKADAHVWRRSMLDATRVGGLGFKALLGPNKNNSFFLFRLLKSTTPKAPNNFQNLN